MSLNRFKLSNCTVSYCTLKQAWEVIMEKDGLEVSYRWFYSKEKAESFALNKPYLHVTFTDPQKPLQILQNQIPSNQ